MKTQTITLTEFMNKQDFFVQEALNNKIFIYPTDTIYGIGMLYTRQNMEKINSIKMRDIKKMCSIVVPNFEWIGSHYSDAMPIEILQDMLNQYHAITYIFDYEKPGVRILKHPFQDFVNKLGHSFITTSVNIAGNPVCLDPNKIPEEILKHVDYVVDDGVLDASASTLVNLVSGEIVER